MIPRSKSFSEWGASLQRTGLMSRRLRAVIAKDPILSYVFANDILHARFQEGEAAIATDEHASYLYLVEILQKPWPLMDQTLKDSWMFQDYSVNFPP